ncbi:MAG: Na+/H+ antiporter NhaA [Actinomycetota bacterium]|nr:Na+/H+ antiporter NhaA [Actinomycetota bacterium]
MSTDRDGEVASPHHGPDEAFPRHRWGESNRFVPRTFVQPFQRLMHEETTGGVVMLIAALVAIVWANSPFFHSYEDLWHHTEIGFEIGDLLHVEHSLAHWVNDALMALFFFMMALEIKRELLFGHLRDPRAAALPAIAAVGGMVIPASIFFAMNAGGAGVDGWGIPMATDIAFAVGVVALVGKRVSPGARVFLLSLAIVDDIGAIIVIALFYTESVSFGWLAAAVVGLVVVDVMRRIDVRSHALILPLGIFVWLCVLESGIHATIAGVALGFLTPAWPFYDPHRFAGSALPLVNRVQRNFDDGLTHAEAEENEHVMADLVRLSRETMSPLQRHLFLLEPWVAFGIVPLFALANAGVRFVDGVEGMDNAVTFGVAAGLILGKTIGVFGATWIAVKAGIGRLPDRTNWSHVVGLAMCSGIGFTVALFVANLAYPDAAALQDSAKIGILGGSFVAGVLGFGILRLQKPLVDEPPAAAAGGAETPASRAVEGSAH